MKQKKGRKPTMEKQIITEEMNVHKDWYKEAHDVTPDTIGDFINHLCNDYQHDYGTICHAVAAGAMAGMHAVDHSDQGGITGFQAGCIMWQIVREIQYSNNKCGLRMVNYDDLLYPQNEHHFKNTISKNAADKLKEEAQKRIDEFNIEHDKWITNHEEWKVAMDKFLIDIVEWQKEHPQYPLYSENPSFYQHIGCGTYEEHQKEHKKIEEGVMFEPREPYEPEIHPEVMAHWKKIAAGELPFDFTISED